MSIKQTARIRYKTEDNPPMEGVPLLGMINITLILFMLLFLFKSYLCINIKNQIIMDGDKQKVNELTMRTLGSHYGGYAYVKVKNRQTNVKIDWKLLRAIEKGEVEIDNEKYHLSGIEYVAKRYQDMFLRWS